MACLSKTAGRKLKYNRVQTPYDILGLPKDATPAEIKRAHREKIKAAHQDRGGSLEQNISVQSAFDILKDPARRKRYDETGDTKKPLDPLLQAQKMAMEMVVNCVAQGQTNFGINPIQQAITKCSGTIRKVMDEMDANKHRAKTLRTVATRINRKSGENLLSQALIGNAEQIDRMNENGKLAIEEMELVKAFLNEFIYTDENPKPPSNGNFSMSGMKILFE